MSDLLPPSLHSIHTYQEGRIVRVPLFRRLQQRRELGRVAVHGVKRREQVLLEGQGGEAHGDGGGGGDCGELGAGK